MFPFHWKAPLEGVSASSWKKASRLAPRVLSFFVAPGFIHGGSRCFPLPLRKSFSGRRKTPMENFQWSFGRMVINLA